MTLRAATTASPQASAEATHQKAGEALESAAKSHKEAAKLHASGDHKALHAALARGYSTEETTVVRGGV